MSVRVRIGQGMLAPLGAVYGLGGWVRRAAHRCRLAPSARLAGPVISVGNLSIGGSGKTPVVAAIATVLRAAGHPVAILSRGYRGAFDGDALVVSDGQTVSADAALAGDEPVMLARELPGVVVAVGRRRDYVGRAVEQRFGPRVHVLDDGFQHLRLARDLDVVCLAPEDLDAWPLPAGALREFAAAARQAQALLVSGEEEGLRRARERFRGLRCFSLGRQVLGFFDREGQPRPAPERPFAFCGIARPERFLSDVAERALVHAGQLLFRDHHAYTADELAALARHALARGADALVTTAKDAARMPALELGLPLRVLRISATVEPAQEFQRLVLDTAEKGLRP